MSSDSGKPSRAGAGLALAGWILLCFGAAAIGSLAMPGPWYASLNKPSWNPPSWIFGPVWTVLYAMMGVAAWLIWCRGGFREQRLPMALFLIQLGFNAAWSPLFFGLKNPGLAFVDILLLWATLLATLVLFWKGRTVAGMLLAPYLAWVTFAAILNFTLWRLNS